MSAISAEHEREVAVDGVVEVDVLGGVAADLDRRARRRAVRAARSTIALPAEVLPSAVGITLISESDPLPERAVRSGASTA